MDKNFLTSIVVIAIILVSTNSAYATKYDTSIFSDALKYADSNTYKNADHGFSIQPPLNWVALNNLPPSVSNNAIVIFSNNDKSQLATFGIYYRPITQNVIDAINNHSDNDVLATIAQEMSGKSADSQTIVYNGIVDRYNDGTRVAISSATRYTADNSTSLSENIIYFLNNGNQYTLDLTSNPDNIDKNSQLFEESANTFLSSQTSLEDQQIKIPTWIKNNAKWWSEDSIGDSDFIKGIQYLISNGIMKVPHTQVGPQKSSSIPSWVKNDAKFWSEGQISDDEFVKGIQYLISNGIITT